MIDHDHDTPADIVFFQQLFDSMPDTDWKEVAKGLNCLIAQMGPRCGISCLAAADILDATPYSFCHAAARFIRHTIKAVRAKGDAGQN